MRLRVSTATCAVRERLSGSQRRRRWAAGEQVRKSGEAGGPCDLRREAGQSLRSQGIGGLRALGIVEVTVATRLLFGIISGCDEIVPPDAEPGPGQIRDVNPYTIA